MYELYVVYGIDYDRPYYIGSFSTAQRAYDYYLNELVPRYKSHGCCNTRPYVIAIDGSHYFDDQMEIQYC